MSPFYAQVNGFLRLSSPRQRYVVLVDMKEDGHHLTYMQSYCAILGSIGFHPVVLSGSRAMLACAENVGATGVQALELERADQFRVTTIVGEIRRAMRRWRALGIEIKRIAGKVGMAPQCVFLCYLDDFVSTFIPSIWIDSLCKWRCSGLYFRPRSNWIKPRLHGLRIGLLHPQGALRARCFSSIGTLDEVNSRVLERSAQKPVVVFPDVANLDVPSDVERKLTQIRERAAGRTVISVLGTLSSRKGLSRMAEAVRSTVNHELLFVMAGAPSWVDMSDADASFVRDCKNGRFPNALVADTFLPDGVFFNAYVAESDIIYVTSANFPYSSNIMVKAAFFRKYTVSEDLYLIGRRIRDYNLGAVFPRGGFVAWCNGISASDIGGFRKTAAFIDGAKQFVEEHAIEKLQRSLRCTVL